MSDASDFADFWITNSVHSDEQMSHRRGREDVQKLADRLVVAANYQGFTKEQMEAEIGDLFSYIRERVDSQNIGETKRLRLDGQ